MEETISPAKDEGAQINSYFVSDAIDHHHMECVKKGCVVSILMVCFQEFGQLCSFHVRHVDDGVQINSYFVSDTVDHRPFNLHRDF